MMYKAASFELRAASLALREKQVQQQLGASATASNVKHARHENVP
jgi:hypothetical protein